MGVVLGVSGRQVEMDRCKGYGEQTTRAMPGYRLVLRSSVGDSICEVDFRFQGAIGDKPEEVNGTQFMSYTLLFPGVWTINYWRDMRRPRLRPFTKSTMLA